MFILYRDVMDLLSCLLPVLIVVRSIRLVGSFKMIFCAKEFNKLSIILEILNKTTIKSFGLHLFFFCFFLKGEIKNILSDNVHVYN